MTNITRTQEAKPAKARGRIENVQLPTEIHPLAISQARAFANLARSLAAAIADGGDDGERLAYQVNAGLSIELYLKALMIGGRGGLVTTGHHLDKLYETLPSFLKEFLEATYSSLQPADGWKVSLKAFKFGTTPAAQRGPGTTPRPKFNSFAASMETWSNAFVQARYFFEKVNSDDWAIFEYAPGPLDAAMQALDLAYQHLLAGSFQAAKDMLNKAS